MHTENGERVGRRWADLLQDGPDALVVPSDLPRPTPVPDDVDTVVVELDGPALSSLSGLARVEPPVVLLALWAALLARTSEQSDLLLGVGLGDETADRLSLVRLAVDVGADVRVLLEAVDAAVTRSRELGPVSVTEVLAALRAAPGTDKHPVFQVAFGRSSDGPGRWPARGDGVVPPDLALLWEPVGDVPRARIDFPRSVFSTAQVERFAGHLRSLLRAAADDPSQAVGSLRLLTAAELSQLVAWNATERPHDGTAPVVARVEQQVRATPGANALELLDHRLTYAELWERAGDLAALLQQRGVGPDVTVGVCFERGLAMAVAVLAVLRAGGAYVPIDPAYPAARRALMLDDAGVAVVLTERSLSTGLPPGAPVLLVDADGRGQTDPQTDAEPPPTLQACEATGANLGYVIFTSGSTGVPKGVALPQRALDNLLAWQLRRPQFTAGARTLQFSSLSFDVSFQELFATWASGGTLVLVSDAVRRDPLTLLAYLDTHRVERLFLPYVALRGLAAAVRSTGRVPSRLREIYTAGEQLQVDSTLVALMEALPDAVLENQYGPSESHVVTAHTLTGPPSTWPALPPVGAPIDNSEVHVLDPRGQLRPVGVPGELFLAGTCLARGYLGRDELTAERFVELAVPGSRSTRLYRTGDLARRREDGELDLLGRLDHQVKFRGFRIEPGEVGTVLSGCPGVERCVAAVQDHPRSGPRLTAYLLPEDPGRELDLAAVHGWARSQLPAHMVPSHYATVRAFPLTSSGKLDVRALPEVEFDRRILSSAFESPRDEQERALAEIWRTVLGVAEVGIRDDWFELGGDSLAAAEMVERVHERLDVELPLGVLAQGPTIAQLAGVLRADGGQTWRSLVPMRTSGSRTPLFVVHGGSGNVATFPRLARGLPEDQPVYALQWDGLDGSRGHRTIEDMATHYLAEVRAVQPHGPYLLAGQCVGGIVAREMTRRLLAERERVDLLVMWDSPHLGSPTYRRGRNPFPLDLFVVANDRKAGLRVVARLALRRTIPPSDRIRHSSIAMVRAVWAHAPGEHPDVRTLYFSSGVSQARKLSLTGSWTDDVLGWSGEESDTFRIHRIDGGHNEIMYEAEALSLLADAVAPRALRT